MKQIFKQGKTFLKTSTMWMYWSDNNLHAIISKHFQDKWNFNIHYVLWNNGVLYLKFYEENLKGKIFWFLSNRKLFLI